ncbi:tetratricopeptide repeat protein [Saccharopolyspora sp. NPDC050642]|uniref:tetratricopeptide repeat protein n=1 Tax=Saccharopolyspora sp. NPDC050642 TaxID=3157099 RepID=UPI00340F6099
MNKRGELEEAERELRAVLKIRRRVLGDDHPDTLAARANLASVLNKRGELEEAERELRAVLKIRRRVLGDDHPDTQHTRARVNEWSLRDGNLAQETSTRLPEVPSESSNDLT